MLKTDLLWMPDTAIHDKCDIQSGETADTHPGNCAWSFIKREIEWLKILMQDDRERYLAEARMQAEGVDEYTIHYLWLDRERHPWTTRLIDCGMAIGNLAHNYYKAKFCRVRPSFVAPGLTPPLGPPCHPSFPSGHSFLGHFLALLLLEIPEIAFRYGERHIGRKGHVEWSDGTNPRTELCGPLFWLANRLAVNRERLGVHYPSDSAASKHLAFGIWDVLLHAKNPKLEKSGVGDGRAECPTLDHVLKMAKAEWSGTMALP